MDTRVSYWVETPTGLALYNMSGQKIMTVPAAQAASFIEAYSAGNPAATDVGKSFAPAARASGGSGGGAGGGTGGFTPVQAATQARQAEQDVYQREQDAASQRRWQEGYDVDKAKFNAQQGLAEAQQKWREAVDARDFKAAEFWKNRSYEMERNQLTRAATNDLYAAKRGPQDWVSYWYRSRGMTPPAGAESVRVEDAIPTWAKPVEYGQGAPTSTAPAWAQTQQTATKPAAAQASQVLDLGKTSSFAQPVATSTAPAWAKSGAQNMPQNAVLADYQGTPISLSDWAVKQLKDAPAWAVQK